MSVWDALFYLNYLGFLAPLNPLVSWILGVIWFPALVALTLVAFRKFQLGTDYGLVQALILLTLGFLIFKARVTEQYAIYLLALSVIDVVLWNPERKRLFQATVVVTFVYLLVNNYFLVRFLSPVYPSFTDVESALSQSIGAVRYAVNFLCGSIFTFLNVWYAIAVLKKKPLSDGQTVRSTG